MRHAHHIHPDELTNPDLLSEIVLASVLVVGIIALMFFLLQTLR
jgi:hypothetical protein